MIDQGHVIGNRTTRTKKDTHTHIHTVEDRHFQGYMVLTWTPEGTEEGKTWGEKGSNCNRIKKRIGRKRPLQPSPGQSESLCDWSTV